uniref:Uncharacterized protein n=1 Tax=Candidatus Caldatribacterium saccharofermentans TaxID=1454753 RepID=A0A7V4TI10_9BACT
MEKEDFYQLAEIVEDLKRETLPRTLDLANLGIREFLALLPQRRGHWTVVPILAGNVLWGAFAFWGQNPKVRFFLLPTSWLKLKNFAFAELLNRSVVTLFEANLRLLRWLLACATILHERKDHKGYLLFAQAFEAVHKHAKAVMKVFDTNPQEYLVLLQGLGAAKEIPYLREALEYAGAHGDILPAPDDLRAQEKILVPQGVPPLSELFPPDPGGGGEDLPCVFFSSKTEAWEVVCLAAIHVIKAKLPYGATALHLLQKNIRREVEGMSLKDREEAIDALVCDLVRFRQTRSAYSLASYVKKRLRAFLSSQESPRTLSEDLLSGPALLTVAQAVDYLLQCFPYKTKQGLQRWLYRKLERGELPNQGVDTVSVGEDGHTQRRRTYLLSVETLKKAEGLLASEKEAIQARESRKREKEALRKLIDLYARGMGITWDSAYRWVRRQVRQGKGMEEIREAIKNRVFRRYLIRECMKTRGVRRRAAEAWLQRELAKGKSLEGLWQELGRGDHGKARKP